MVSDTEVHKEITALYRRIHKASVVLNCRQIATSENLDTRTKIELMEYLINRSRRITGDQVEVMMERLASDDAAVMNDVCDQVTALFSAEKDHGERQTARMIENLRDYVLR